MLVCLFVCLFVRSHTRKTICTNSGNCLYMLTVVAARYCCDKTEICYGLPVLWMTSCLHIMVHMARKRWEDNVTALRGWISGIDSSAAGYGVTV